MLTGIKAALFDIDGTLVNSLSNYLQAYKTVLQYYGFDFTNQEVVGKCFGKTEEVIVAGLGMPEKAQEFRQLYFTEVTKNIPQLQLFPDALYTLDAIYSKKIKIGIITFAYNWYLKKIMARFNLEKYTDITIGFNDVVKAKPNPEAVITACTALEIAPQQALVIGDSKSDVFMGHGANSKTVLYTPDANKQFYDFATVIAEAKPTYVVSTLSQIVTPS